MPQTFRCNDFLWFYLQELLLILSEYMDHEKKQVIVVHPETSKEMNIK